MWNVNFPDPMRKVGFPTDINLTNVECKSSYVLYGLKS